MIILIPAEKTRHFPTSPDTSQLASDLKVKAQMLPTKFGNIQGCQPTPASSNYDCIGGSLGGDETDCDWKDFRQDKSELKLGCNEGCTSL